MDFIAGFQTDAIEGSAGVSAITDLCCRLILGNSTASSIMCYIVSVLGKYAHDMSTLHNCMKIEDILPIDTYQCCCMVLKQWSLKNADRRKVNVVWNNSFRHIFHSCWCESVKTLQYVCQLLPIIVLSLLYVLHRA